MQHGAAIDADSQIQAARIRRLARRLSPDVAPIRGSREFRLLYFGQAGSSAGVIICYVALPYQGYQISHSSLVVGLLSVAELLPVLLAGLVGGALADGLERRSLILITQAVAVCCAAVLVANALAWRQLWLVFALAGLLAGAFGMQRPSVDALVPLLVRHDDLPGAAALAGLLGTVSQTAGPLLAGGLLTGGIPLAYRHVHRHGRAIALAVCGWGIAIAAFAYAPGLPLAVLALAVAGGSDMVSGIFRMTMWNQTIPSRVRGRLAGLEMISYSTGEPLGNLEAGAVATLTGSVRAAVVSGGLLSLAGAVIVSLALPALWRYDARENPAKPGPMPEPVPAQP